MRAVAGRCCELEERDWEMLLLALDWLVDNQDATYFVRQLPIRGIDTKWMEGHQGLVKPLHRALTGRDPQFARQAGQFRVHVLDERLAPGDLTDLALSVEQLGRWPRLPDCVLICENMVNVLALPPLPGVIAIHGGGFAVGELASVPWLSHVPLLYWGDLDSNGFAILNQLRSHHGHCHLADDGCAHARSLSRPLRGRADAEQGNLFAPHAVRARGPRTRPRRG